CDSPLGEHTMNAGSIPIAQSACPTSAAASKLLDRVHAALRTRHYSRRTEQACVHWINRYIFFHHLCRPPETGHTEIRHRYHVHETEIQRAMREAART